MKNSFMIDNVLACHEVFPTYIQTSIHPSIHPCMHASIHTYTLHLGGFYDIKMSTNIFFDLYFLECDRMVSHSLFFLFWQFGALQLLTTVQSCVLPPTVFFFVIWRSKISCFWHVMNNIMNSKICGECLK